MNDYPYQRSRRASGFLKRLLTPTILAILVPVKLIILLGHSHSHRDSSPSCEPRHGFCSQPVTIYTLRL
ncbi:uncharacterized protein LACBIDRAFT_304886 [Laccaria bicolor S238N-H82]|uniref:Predicted protein n=1 Tax=Laccaria bicolor (strain S238N-H82 / ATCC MYA-4686) TaxID=486041 RepID=B0DMK2_LACBS|nr:uncharacterized protein LACBIDRAFT_304886 [Laccaria bicolor S238N-H82]EDR04202.1 predicted protein [Laccaria bicolor S238N-H82]|eukprot:XP_001885093.1 predicted protein [Laccaria bicolor S238N-H82]